MKRLLLPALAGLLILSGCARKYVIIMGNGERITTVGKPRLDGNYYHFKDASGREGIPIHTGRVREIAPASMASPSPNSPFKPKHSD